MKPGAKRTSAAVRKSKPMTSREKVRAHRERLRAKGMRPVTLWVPDVRSPKFAAEARRQCRQANVSPHAQADQAWVESMSDWKSD